MVLAYFYYTKLHVKVVLTPQQQAALYIVAGMVQFLPTDLLPAPTTISFNAIRRRRLIDGDQLTDLGRAWIKAELESAHKWATEQ